MKKLFLISMIIVRSCIAFAQNYHANDSIEREIQFPLTEKDTETVFFYLNNEWIAGAYLDLVPTESIQKMEVKNDEYGNRAVFLTVPSETFAGLKAEIKKRFINLDPRCEFPGGNGKLKEWIDANIQVPEAYKGCERVMVRFTVLPDGSIRNPQITKPSKNKSANEEALRLINALPNFRVKYYTPRKSNLNYSISITFREPGAIFIRGDENKGNKHEPTSSADSIGDKPLVFAHPYQSPYYLNGGDDGLLSDLYTTLSKIAPVTEDSVKGRALVSFIISKEGIIDPNSMKVWRNRSVPDDYLKAAFEAIKSLGKFEPGKFDGEPKNVTYNISIIYPTPLEHIKTIRK